MTIPLCIISVLFFPLILKLGFYPFLALLERGHWTAYVHLVPISSLLVLFRMCLFCVFIFKVPIIWNDFCNEQFDRWPFSLTSNQTAVFCNSSRFWYHWIAPWLYNFNDALHYRKIGPRKSIQNIPKICVSNSFAHLEFLIRHLCKQFY